MHYRDKTIGRSSLHFPKMAKVIAFTPWWAPEDRQVRTFSFPRPPVVGSSHCSCFREMIVPGSFSNAKSPALNIRTMTLSPIQSWAGMCTYSMTVLAGLEAWTGAGMLTCRGFTKSRLCLEPWRMSQILPLFFPLESWIRSFFYKVKEVVPFIVRLSSLFCFGGPAANNELSCGL